MSSQAKVQSDSTQLYALATGLCHAADIKLQISDDNWSWNPVDRILTVSSDSIDQYGPEYCAGFVGHEVGHIFVSRYVLFKPAGVLEIEAAGNLLNALEDPRSDHWISQRYPGVKHWLEPLRRDDLYRPFPEQMPDFIKFCLECCREPYRQWQPAPEGVLSETIIDALESTRPSRQSYTYELPPVNESDDGAGSITSEFYYSDVYPNLRFPQRDQARDQHEMLVQCSSWRARQIALNEVFPVARQLLESDLNSLAATLASPELESRVKTVLDQDELEPLLEVLEVLLETRKQGLGKNKSKQSHVELAKKLFLKILKGMLRLIQGLQEVEGLQVQPGGGSRGSGKVASSVKPIVGVGITTRHYDEVYQNHQLQISQLVKNLEAVLLPQKRLRERNGFPSGTSVDLRQLMAFDANPCNYRNLWRRKTLPDRHRTVISLLVDLSGSMRGDKAQAALAGTVVLAETLTRLGIEFSIDGFQDELIPLCEFGEGLTSRVRQNIEEIPLEVKGERPGGHNNYVFNDDGPCLEEAAELLLDRPATDYFLIVISDGGPAGRRSQAEDLVKAINRLEAIPELQLIGVGIGPDTEHVNKYYSNAIANVPVNQFADQIGSLVRKIVLG